jgi:hypothetical protein
MSQYILRQRLASGAREGIYPLHPGRDRIETWFARVLLPTSDRGHLRFSPSTPHRGDATAKWEATLIRPA